MMLFLNMTCSGSSKKQANIDLFITNSGKVLNDFHSPGHSIRFNQFKTSATEIRVPLIKGFPNLFQELISMYCLIFIITKVVNNCECNKYSNCHDGSSSNNFISRPFLTLIYLPNFKRTTPTQARKWQQNSMGQIAKKTRTRIGFKGRWSEAE